VSAYCDWFSDFPNRTLGVLDDLRLVKNRSLWKRRGVTILLMTACSGFVIPFERLDPNRAEDLGDDTSKTAKKYRDKLKFTCPFIESEFVKDASAWRDGKVASIVGEPDSWPGLSNAELLEPSYSTLRVLRRMRNALSHGTVWTNSKQEIRNLIFVARQDKDDSSKGFEYLTVPVEEFEHFLKTWLVQIAKLGSSVYALSLLAA
jgi:hypothetical protein